jgi:hypothetical protein
MSKYIKKTLEQKREYFVNKMALELSKVKIKRGFEVLKLNDNKKMEGYYTFIPNINLVQAFNAYISNNKQLLDNSDIKLLNDFTLNNNVCNKERCTLCSNYCYCEHARFYNNNVSSRLNMLLYYLTDSKLFAKRVNSQIDLEGIELLRLHTEGDFFSIDYLKFWFEIVQANRQTVFYTYTKQFELFDCVEQLPNNFYLELSFDTSSQYSIPFDLLTKGNVNIYLTYHDKDKKDVADFIQRHNLQHMQVYDCNGSKCKKCRNCYKNSGCIHLCLIH